MEFEWDPAKAAENRRKHHVELADAVGVLEDPYALTRRDPAPGEERWVTVGRDHLDRVVVLAWTWAGPRTIRLISARAATPRERRHYAEDADA